MSESDPDRSTPAAFMLAESAGRPFEPAPSGASAAGVDLEPPIRLLLLDQEQMSCVRLRSLFAQVAPGRFEIDWVRDFGRALERLGQADAALCIIGERLEGGLGLALVEAAQNRATPVPIIMLSGSPALETDQQAMALGVADFLDHEHLDGVILERTVRYTLARRRQAERLSHLAQHDELTGLANRVLLQDRLQRALAWGRRHDRLVAVMILDLNGFKIVNDGLGHAAGDRLLCIMAERFRQRLRETDTVARLGGDEFALVIENLAKPEHAALVARKLLDAVAPSATIDERAVEVTASVGVALFPKDGSSVAELLQRADGAMYRAKAEGGNLFRFASPQLERQVQRGALLESDLRRGLETGEFALHYQPQVGLSGTDVAVAGLIRWHHRELGPIGPERFLPLTEDMGLIGPMTEWLLTAALDQLASWRDLGLGRLHLALPLLSRRQLAWTAIAERLEGRLRAAGLPGSAVEIEVEEDRLLEDIDAGGAGLRRLKTTGVRLALDGFGSGVTSLRSLKLGMLDTVKLDHALLKGVPADETQAALTGAIIELARNLDFRVVAAGADTQPQVAFLRRKGCSAVQAFMSCPPLPADACTRWLRQAAVRRDRLSRRSPPLEPATLPAVAVGH